MRLLSYGLVASTAVCFGCAGETTSTESGKPASEVDAQQVDGATAMTFVSLKVPNMV